MFPLQDDNPTTRTPVVTYAIIAINVLVFLWTLGLSAQDSQTLTFRYGLVPARVAQLFTGKPIVLREESVVFDAEHGQLIPLSQVVQIQPDRPRTLLSMITCMFLHGGWLHLLGNMWFLWIFGDNVEDRLGPARYLLFYLGGGVLAMLAHCLQAGAGTVPVIGASGAVAVILGAYAITWPWSRVRTLVFLVFFVTIIDLPALVVLGVWFLGQLLSGMHASGPAATAGVAWWAHIGGFAVGMALMPLFAASDATPPDVTPPGDADPHFPTSDAPNNA